MEKGKQNCKIKESKDKWITFLSSIKPLKYSSTEHLVTETKSNSMYLAQTFADQLLENKNKDRKNQDHNKPLEAGKDQTETPTAKRNIPLGKADMSVQKDHAIIQGMSQTDTTEHVKETSAQNDDAITPEVPKTDARKQVKEGSAQHDHAINTIKKKPQTDNLDKPSSYWTISNIAEYVSFDNCIIEIKMPNTVFSNLNNIYEMVSKAIENRLEIVKSKDLKSKIRNSDTEFEKKLISITTIETGSRLVLDALLFPLCSALNLQLEVEKNINYNCLPTCRFDYCIRKKDHIIGCIEAKCVKSLRDKSIAQAVLQLFVLQKTFREEDERSPFPFFAIVTDGHRFIYMQLTGSHLGFEHDNGKLMIRTVKKMDDFKDILQHIMCLVDYISCIKN